MVSAYGFGVIGKIIGPLGLALIVGSSNYLKPDVPLPQIPVAFLYLGCWFLMAGTVYCFFGIETRGKSIEQIDRELAEENCQPAMPFRWWTPKIEGERHAAQRTAALHDRTRGS